jgi:CRP-like cAMP-binding protein
VAALERAMSGSRIALSNPAPSVIVKHAGINSITYEMTCFIADIARTGEATNELFDLAYRHLAAAQIILRSLTVPPALAAEHAEQRSSLLSKVQMFDVLDSDEVHQLASRLSRHEYEAAETIVTADQVIDYLLIVASGVLSVTVHRANPVQPNEKIEIARLGPEDSFGESGVLSGVPMSVDITAMTQAVLYRLDKQDLGPLLKKRPELGHSMCRLLSQRQDYTRTFIHEEAHDVKTESGLFQWLWEGMRRLHELTE